MPAQNYVLLERVEVGEAAVSSITFNSIPQTGYTDLKIVVSGREVTGTSLLFTMQINGVATNQSTREVRGSGSTATSGTNTIATIDQNGSGTTASTFGNAEIYIPNYTSANYKSYSIDSVSENNATAAYMRLSAGLWSSTAAITSLSFFPSSGNIAQYSTFSLYGLAAVGTTPTRAPKASGGSIIQTDGTYWYHAFLASGTFTPAVGLSCDVLSVAGGGGGSGNDFLGAGGGAGGLLYTTGASFAASAYTVTVGAGGAGATSTPTAANKGNNTVISSYTATGGGAGDSNLTYANGGSGGGGSNTTAGTGTSGQGNNGGISFYGASVSAGGGGGGAGAVGTAGISSKGGNGGAGTNTYSSWLTTIGQGGASGYLAGGGGGGTEASGGTIGTGGSGGGGSGGKYYTTTLATAGTVNTGGGGGGGANPSANPGKAGGSGILIIRYAV